MKKSSVLIASAVAFFDDPSPIYSVSRRCSSLCRTRFRLRLSEI
jgi:hypothetical protein